MPALILALPTMEYWLEFWWVFPIALGICIAVCVVGISGGVLFVPLFAVGFPALGIPLTAVQAVQIGLFSEIFGFSSSTVAFWRNDLIDVRTAGYSLLFAIPLAVVGGLLSNVLPVSTSKCEYCTVAHGRRERSMPIPSSVFLSVRAHSHSHRVSRSVILCHWHPGFQTKRESLSGGHFHVNEKRVR